MTGRAYRWKRGHGIAGLATATLIAAAGVVLPFVAYEREGPGIVVAGIACVLFALFVVAWALTESLRLDDDAIERRLFGRVRRLRCSEIVGRRRGRDGLEVVGPTTHVPISSSLALDAEAMAWLEALPDLDAKAAAEAQAESDGDLALGPTVEARRAAIERGRRLARALFVVLAVCVVIGLVPSTPTAASVALAAVPPVLALGLVVGTRGAVRVDDAGKDPRAHVAVALLLPSCVVGLRALPAWPGLLEPWGLAALGAAIGLALAAPLFVARRVGRPRHVGFVALLLALQGGASLVCLNAALDGASAPPVHVAVEVGHADRDGCYVTLAPWGPLSSPTHRSLRGELCEAAATGVLCATLHEGALGSPWYALDRCE